MAIADKVVNFLVKISGDVKDLQRDLNRVERDATQSSSRLQTAAGKAGSFIAANWQAGAMAAGTAVAAFAVKAVGEFQRTALEADKLGTSLGTGVEQASRWMEVAGDLGVETGTLEGAFQRMNKAAEGGALKSLGIDAENASDRFIQTLEYLRGISDETLRAKEAQRILGRSWQELAPLVNQVGELRDRLADVSDAKVIDPEEVEKARRYRDAMDALNDAVQDVSLALGESLIPLVSDLAKAMAEAGDLAGKIPLPDWMRSGGPQLGGLIAVAKGLGDIVSGSDDASDELDYLSRRYEYMGRQAVLYTEVMRQQVGVQEDVRVGVENMTVTVDYLARSYDRLGAGLAEYRRQQEALLAWVEQYQAQLGKAQGTSEVGTGTVPGAFTGPGGIKGAIGSLVVNVYSADPQQTVDAVARYQRNNAQ
jgi:hypothetical protein